MKKIISLALALVLVLVLSMQTVVFAVDNASADVKGTYKAEQTQTVYTVDIVWSGLDFTYTATTSWDADDLAYETTGAWSGNGSIKLTNRTDVAIKATPTYAKATGFEDAEVKFYNGDQEIQKLDIASAAPAVGETTGSAKTGTITVKPSGNLPKDTTAGTTIGQITIEISNQ